MQLHKLHLRDARFPFSRDSEPSSESSEDDMSESYCTSDEEEQEDPKDYRKGQH